MKITTPSAVVISLALSVLCHASVSLFFIDSTVDEMLDGGVQGDVAMIGTSFADMVSKDNMIARSEPEETTQVEPEPIQPEETSSSAEQVTDTKATKPTAVKPLESVKAQTVAPAASEPVAKPVESSQNSPQPDAATVETTPLQPAESAPKTSLSAVADMPTSLDAPPETAFIPPIANTVADAKSEVQTPAFSETQTSPLQTIDQADKTPTTAQSSATATSSEGAKPADEKQMASATPQQSQAAETVPAVKPQPAPETQQSTTAQIAPLKPASPTETAIASDVAQTAEEGVPAPRARPPQPYDGKLVASKPEPVVKKAAQKPTQKQTQKKTKKRQPAAKGNQSKTQRSAQNNSGKSTVTASRGGGKGSKTKAAGNAKASNYPGLVYRKIQRTRQKRVGGRGSVRIRFSISSNGRLAGISVARSSGSSKVDKAALAHIRRSAPFPTPPKGARRSFTIPVEIRR